MSENPDGLEQWRRMLESMLGPEAAEEAMRAISESGMDLSNLPVEINPTDFQAAMSQLNQFLTQDGGQSHWEFATQAATQVAAQNGDPMVSAALANQVRSVMTVADLWLDTAMSFDPAGGPITAASRVEWAKSALPTLRTMAEPVGSSVADALVTTLKQQMEQAPALGPVDVTSMMSNLGRLGFAMQVGQATGTLAREVFGGFDIGVGLQGSGRMLIPENISTFAKDLDTPEEEVWHFLAVRETAHARLYEHVPWLRAHILGAIEQYARGIEIDLDELEASVRDINPTDIEQIRSALSGDIFLSDPNESQRRALTRLETTLALIEGWVEEVTANAVAPHLPHGVALRELLRRRRAAGGPAEETFHTLVGLQLRPRRVREAASLWALLTKEKGMEARDELWSQLDLMPTTEDLDDPESFVKSLGQESDEYAELDAELAKILSDAHDSSSQSQTTAETPPATAGDDAPTEDENPGDAVDGNNEDTSPD